METVGDQPLHIPPPEPHDPKLLFAKAGDVTLVPGKDASFHVYTNTSFLGRLWKLFSNPFVYLFTGHWRL